MKKYSIGRLWLSSELHEGEPRSLFSFSKNGRPSPLFKLCTWKNKCSLRQERGAESEVLCLNGTWPLSECIGLCSTFTKNKLNLSPPPRPSPKISDNVGQIPTVRGPRLYIPLVSSKTSCPEETRSPPILFFFFFGIQPFELTFTGLGLELEQGCVVTGIYC